MAARDRSGWSRREQGGSMPFGRDVFASPFSMMRRMADEMNQLFSAGMGGVHTMMAGLAGFPIVDVRETAGTFVVEAEIPGVNPKDVDVQIQGDTLVIRGQCQRSTESQEEGYFTTERHYGTFCREIPLPGPVKAEEATARCENGVLEVRLPKTEQTAGRRIQVAGVKSEERPESPNAIPSGENAVSQRQVESSPENQGGPGENQSGLSAEQEAETFEQEPAAS